MYATAANSITCAQILVPLESNFRSLKGEKSIEIAARKGYTEIFKYLWIIEGEDSINVGENAEIV